MNKRELSSYSISQQLADHQDKRQRTEEASQTSILNRAFIHYSSPECSSDHEDEIRSSYSKPSDHLRRARRSLPVDIHKPDDPYLESQQVPLSQNSNILDIRIEAQELSGGIDDKEWTNLKLHSLAKFILKLKGRSLNREYPNPYYWYLLNKK